MTTIKTGPHELEVEEPDLVTMRWRGPLGAAEFSRACELLREHCARWPRILILNDLTHVSSIPPETRRIVPDATGWMPMRGVAMFGGSFAMRTLATLLLKVVNLVQGGDNPSYFSATETEAREWIERRRAQLRTKDEPR